MQDFNFYMDPRQDSGPFTRCDIRPFAIPVFTTDREMALYPRIAISQTSGYRDLSGYRDQWGIAKDDNIATSKKVQNLEYLTIWIPEREA